MLPPVDRLQSCRGCHLSDCHSVVQLSCCRVAQASDGETRLLADRVQRVPRKRSGARSRSGERCRGENRCDRGRTLPEYFTDDPVVVKTVVIRGLAIKSHADVARRRRPRPEPVAVPFYSPLFPVSDRPRRVQHNAEASHSNGGGLPSFALIAKLAGRVVQVYRGSRYRFATRNNIISDSAKKFQCENIAFVRTLLHTIQFCMFISFIAKHR